MQIEKLFGERLRQLRKLREFTQENLANEIGISTTHLRTLEQGNGNPTLKTLQKLSFILNTSIGYLAGEKEDET